MSINTAAAHVARLSLSRCGFVSFRSSPKLFHASIRCLSASPKDDDNDHDARSSSRSSKRALSSVSPHPSPSSQSQENSADYVDETLRGVGQVIFLNSKRSGIVLLGGLALGNPYLATLALAGAGVSTATAKLAGLDGGMRKDGLWGYNGCLVGCAAAVFVSPLPSATDSLPVVTDAASLGLFASVMGASVAPLASVALKEAMGGVPQWTLAFNGVALSALLRTQPLAPKADAAAEISASQPDMLAILESPFRGVSQIFVVDSSISGVAILGGTAMYSPGLALHLLSGSAVGSLTGYALCSAPIDEILCGLWGYNSALTSMGVGAFFVHSNRTLALSVGGAAITAAMFGAMKGIFASWGSPCLTVPFCTAMSGCYLLGRGGVPGLKLADSPHSPEKNE